MDEKEFEERVKNCHFLQQIFAEMLVKQRQQDEAIIDALTMVSGCIARQSDAARFLQNLNGMSKTYDRIRPNPLRSELIDSITGFIAGPATGMKSEPPAH